MPASPEHIRDPRNIVAAAIFDSQPATNDNHLARDLHRQARERKRIGTFTPEEFNKQILDPEGIPNSTIETICRKIQKHWVEHPGTPPTAGFEPVGANGAATEAALRSHLELAQRFSSAPEFAALNGADQAEIQNQLMRAIIDAPQTDSLDPAERSLAVNQMLENRFKELKNKLFTQIKALKDKPMLNVYSSTGENMLEKSFQAFLIQQGKEATAQRDKNLAERERDRLIERQTSFGDHTPGHLGHGIDQLEAQIEAKETPAGGGTRDITYLDRFKKEKEMLEGEIKVLSEEINTKGADPRLRQGRSVRRDTLIPRMNEVNRLIAEYGSVKDKLDALINERDGKEVEENGRKIRKGNIQEKIDEAEQILFGKEQGLDQERRTTLLTKGVYEEIRDERDKNEQTLAEDGSNLFKNAAMEIIKTNVADILAGRDNVAAAVSTEQKDALHTSLRIVVNNRWITRRRNLRRGHWTAEYQFKEDTVKNDFAYLLAHGPKETARHVLQDAGVPLPQIDSMLANPDIKKEIDQQLIQQLMANRIFVGKISRNDGMRLVQSDWYDQYVPQALLGDGSVRKKLENKFDTLKKEGVIPMGMKFEKRWYAYIIGTLGLTVAGAALGGPISILSAATHAPGAIKGLETGVAGSGIWEFHHRRQVRNAKLHGKSH